MDFNFKDLFVLDIANNHQGSLEHGKKIINKHSAELKKKNVKAGFKFQFRNLETFIHRDFKGSKDTKHISRFESTKLSDREYQELFNLIKENNFFTICTAFDEISVDKIIKMKFDIIKVASCSSNDWPLLEKVSKAIYKTD